MLHHCARLLLRGNSCPQREKRRHIFVVRALPVFKVVVEVQSSHGIQIGDRDAKKERRFLAPSQIQELLTKLSEPCYTIVVTAVLTGMRIGEILALKWNRLDFLRGHIEVSETYSDGKFGTPKTRSSRRVIPMSSALRGAFETHRAFPLTEAASSISAVGVMARAACSPTSSRNHLSHSLIAVARGSSASAPSSIRFVRTSISRSHRNSAERGGRIHKNSPGNPGPLRHRNNTQHVHACNPGLAAACGRSSREGFVPRCA
jgi:integrase